jgi:hypothetical protein
MGCSLKLYRSSSVCSGSSDDLDYFAILNAKTLLEVDTEECSVLKIERE